LIASHKMSDSTATKNSLGCVNSGWLATIRIDSLFASPNRQRQRCLPILRLGGRPRARLSLQQATCTTAAACSSLEQPGAANSLSQTPEKALPAQPQRLTTKPISGLPAPPRVTGMEHGHPNSWGCKARVAYCTNTVHWHIQLRTSPPYLCCAS
jgi:hypothetical protein